MADQPVTISKIAVRGFKSIADEQQVELRPLTLLAGANSSGKSSLMQPILLLKQTLEAPSDPGALLMDGPNVRFTSAEQLLSQVSREVQSSEFSVSIGLSDGASLETVFKHEGSIGFEIASMTYGDGQKKQRLVPGMSEEEVFDALPASYKAAAALDLAILEEKLYWSIYRDRCFLICARYGQETKRPRILYSIFCDDRFIPQLQGLIHLPGLRGNPQRTYAKRATGPLFPGTFENYHASIISQWQSKNDPRLRQLSKALEDVGLTWKVQAKPVDDTQVELRVGRLPHSRSVENHDLVNIADVGFGVSQTLPVLVALIVAEPGQVVYLEQPELHLHPRAQRRLAHVLADAANRGVTVVAETHSSLLLREVQTIVATGELSTDRVKLHWFQRQEDGRTVVTPADLDENGAYGDWPEDFDEVELDAEKAYLNAVEEKKAGA